MKNIIIAFISVILATLQKFRLEQENDLLAILGSKPPKFIADHPFLFLGRVMEPDKELLGFIVSFTVKFVAAWAPPLAPVRASHRDK